MIIASGALPLLAADEAPSPIIPETGEIIVGLIAFVLVAFLLVKYLFPRMEKTFQARVEAIEGGIAKAEAAQAEANALLEQYRSQLAEARTEAAGIRDEARAEGLAIIEDLRAEAQAESERIIARGNDQLAAQRETIVAELRGEIGRISVDLASRIIGENLADDTRARATVERFLTELEGETSGTTAGRA
jgi:F-type H+-transporting ATPase subunit b